MGKNQTRRDFIKTSAIVAGATALLGTGCASKQKSNATDSAQSNPKVDPQTASKDPIRMIDSLAEQKAFTGDDPHRAHPILWNVDGKLKEMGGLPTRVDEEADVVIIGGGMSGLLNAYNLIDKKPIVLEQAPQLGGNSKGEKWRDTTYSLAAAYIVKPDAGGPIEKFLKEIDIYDDGHIEEGGGPMTALHHDAISADFWNGSTDPSRKKDFQEFYGKLKEVREKSYPDIPYELLADPKKTLTHEEKMFMQYDSMTMHDWMKKNVKNVHPHIREYVNGYTQSAMLSKPDELSAAQALNFIAGEIDGVMVFPGGNSSITQRIYDIFKDKSLDGNLRTSCMTVDVRAGKTGVYVTYIDAAGSLKRIHAKQCIVSCAKFIARKIVKDIPKKQFDAMASVKYRAFVVANLLVNHGLRGDIYELFRVHDRDKTGYNAEMEYTDIIFGSFAEHGKKSRSALTLYKPYAHDGGRPELLYAKTLEALRGDFEKWIPGILKAANVDRKDITEIRLSRWGHAFPIGHKNYVASGQSRLANSPIKGVIHFSHQDTWGSPAFEPCFGAAMVTSTIVRKLLG